MRKQHRETAQRLLDLARRIRAARVESGLSIFELAHEVGVGSTTIRNWETGRAVPSIPTLFLFAAATGSQPEALIA